MLQLKISAGKLNLLRGKATSLSIDISGLEGLETAVPITITNNSPSNISLEEGNNQEISIQPNGNEYQLRQAVRATQGGGFSISVNIEPDTPEEELDKDDQLCNCVFEAQTALISSGACEALGGQCYAPENPILLIGTRKEAIGDAIGNYNFTFKNLLSSADDIEDLEDDILEEWEKWDRAKHAKDSLNELYNDLVTIDKILDRIPGVYKDKLKKAVDDCLLLWRYLMDFRWL